MPPPCPWPPPPRPTPPSSTGPGMGASRRSGRRAVQAAGKPAVRVWAQTTSDVKADPDIRFGTLPNGMRFAIRRQTIPANQASLRLWFDAGSLMETDAQAGLAHFLEHMAFNGSKAVPEGDMVKILERLGLAFGADTNASTNFQETIYKLDLPQHQRRDRRHLADAAAPGGRRTHHRSRRRRPRARRGAVGGAHQRHPRLSGLQGAHRLPAARPADADPLSDRQGRGAEDRAGRPDRPVLPSPTTAPSAR